MSVAQKRERDVEKKDGKFSIKQRQRKAYFETSARNLGGFGWSGLSQNGSGRHIETNAIHLLERSLVEGGMELLLPNFSIS